MAGKMLSALAAALLLLPIGWLAAYVMTFGSPPNAMHHASPFATAAVLWGGSVLAIFEVFAWAVLFSLLLNRVLWATVLGAATAAFFGFYAARGVVAVSLSLWSAAPVQTDYYVESMPLRVLSVLAVLALDMWLAQRWFAPDRARLFPLPVAKRNTTAMYTNSSASACHSLPFSSTTDAGGDPMSTSHSREAPASSSGICWSRISGASPVRSAN